MTQEDKELLLKDLCARLPHKLYIRVEEFNVPKNEAITEGFVGSYLKDNRCNDYDADAVLNELADDCINVKPYLRPMSSMTEEEKKELLCTVVGKDAVKYFQVLPDGSIDNTDASHQDLQNFTMHWVNFDGDNTTSYIDWLNAHYFDYRGLIEKGLALEAPKDIYKVKEK